MRGDPGVASGKAFLWGGGEQELALGGWEKGQMGEARSGSQQAGSWGLWANVMLSFSQRR